MKVDEKNSGLEAVMSSNSDGTARSNSNTSESNATSGEPKTYNNSSCNYTNGYSGDPRSRPSKKQKSRHPITKHAKGVHRLWSSLMDKLRDGVTYVVLLMADSAAAHPWWYVIGTLLLSGGLVGIGMATNFEYSVSQYDSLTPKNSVIREQKHWILEESGFPPEPLSLRALVHRNREGSNVLTREGVDHAFQVLEKVQAVDSYHELCDEASEVNDVGYGGLCQLRGVSLFWNHSRAIMEGEITSDVDLILAVNSEKYPDGSDVEPREIMGHMTYHNDVIISAESFLLEIVVPASRPNAEEVIEIALDTLLDLRKEWASNSTTSSFQLEVYLDNHSLEAETLRAVFKDLPLIPTVFVVMTVFTCLVFSTSHKPGDTQVKQRIFLGIGAVVTVVLSMTTSYGLLWAIGEHA